MNIGAEKLISALLGRVGQNMGIGRNSLVGLDTVTNRFVSYNKQILKRFAKWEGSWGQHAPPLLLMLLLVDCLYHSLQQGRLLFRSSLSRSHSTQC